MTDPVLVFLVLIGAPVGSFLAAFADRWCAGRSLWPRSRCGTCDNPIGWPDLIPLVSWLVLRGRCRMCGAGIPLQLFLAEAAGFLISLVVVVFAASAAHALSLACVFWLLLGLALCDLRCFRLPDVLTGLLLVAASGLAAIEARLGAGLLGGLIAFGVLAALRLAYARIRGHEGLGLGDVKLAAGLGVALGPLALPWLGLLASCAGLIAAACGAWGGLRADVRVPFGLFLCISAAAVLIWQRASL